MKKIVLLFFLVTAMAGIGWCQERVVTGKVTSAEDATPLPGVNIVLKGTTNGTVTDAEGNYKLNVPQSGVLVFSFIGFQSVEVEMGQRSIVDVPLTADVTELTEVVVTALGIEKSAKSVGYSVSKVKSDELNRGKAYNVAQALTGKVAGLQINNVSSGVNPSTRITLRGNRSFTGNNQALIVIDGMQSTQEALNYINSNDIENVSVLKGANAAALYGSDASNGALIITTKKGNSGAPVITLSNTTNWESINFLPAFQKGFGAGTEKYSRVYNPFENQSYGPAYDGSVSILGRQLEDGTYQTTPYSYKEGAKKKSFDVGQTVQNSVSMNGGDKMGDYFISAQDVSTTGVVPGDKSRRTGLRVNASRSFGKLKAGMNFNYSLRKTDRTTSDFYDNVLNTPGSVPLNEYRNWRPYRHADGSMNYANPNNYFNDYFYNPFMAKDLNRQDENYTYLIGNINLSYQMTDWLTATYRLGLTNETYDYLLKGEAFAYNAYAKTTAKSVAKDIPGYSTNFIGRRDKLVQDFILNFKKEFGPLSTNLILGNNVRAQRSVGIMVGANPLVLPDVYNISNRSGEISGNQGLSQDRVLGYYADLTLGYKDFLFLHASGRNDSYSVLAKENRSFFYPGADLSFVFSDAIPVLRNNGFLDYAKLNVAVTKVGNVNLDPYSLQTVFDTGNGFPYGSTVGFSQGDTYADPNLKPEFTTSYEAGGDFAFWNNRLGVELAYYTQETVSQTVSIDIATSTGFSRARVNAGSMKNSGFETTLDLSPIVTSDGFKWQIGGNYALTNTKVTSLYGDNQNINISNLYQLTTDGSLAQVFAEIGRQYPIIKAVAYQRDPQGRVVVDPVTGYPLKDSNLQSFGQANPKHKLGINTTLRYKGWTLYGLAEYRGGNVIYHGIGNTLWFTGAAEATAAYNRERFIFPNSSYLTGDGNYVENTSVATADGGLSTWDSNLKFIGENFITSAAFWKLREVSLTYDLPNSFLTKTNIVKGARVGFIGRNLWMWLSKENKYTDPELAVNNSNAVGINNTRNTPSTRTYGFNVTLTF